MSDLKALGDSGPLSEKEYILGRHRRGSMSQRTRTALYLRVSTADQKPDLQQDSPCVLVTDHSYFCTYPKEADECQI